VPQDPLLFTWSPAGRLLGELAGRTCAHSTAAALLLCLAGLGVLAVLTAVLSRAGR
jgi:hypothetical protein